MYFNENLKLIMKYMRGGYLIKHQNSTKASITRSLFCKIQRERRAESGRMRIELLTVEFSHNKNPVNRAQNKECSSPNTKLQSLNVLGSIICFDHRQRFSSRAYSVPSIPWNTVCALHHHSLTSPKRMLRCAQLLLPSP